VYIMTAAELRLLKTATVDVRMAARAWVVASGNLANGLVSTTEVQRRYNKKNHGDK
jgi:hypothetical protein